jgi:hypothetical protein
LKRRLNIQQALKITGQSLGETVQERMGSGRRGVALIFTMVAMMILVTFSLNFIYNERTSIYMNGNITASAKAHLHARGAMKVALLAVNAKRSFPMLKSALSLMGKSGGAKIEVWRQACEFTKVFCEGKPHFFGTELMDLSEEESVNLNRGSCECRVTSEDSRINLNAASTDRATATAQAIANPAAARAANRRKGSSRSKAPRPASRAQARLNLGIRLFGLFRPLMEQGNFDNEDEITTLVANIMDWTDEDDAATMVERFEMALKVSDEGTGPEPSYDDYESKDAKMDSVGEVQLVEGMTSDLFCKFRDDFTVFATDKVNVNDAGLAVLKGVLCEAITDDLSRMKYCFNPATPTIQPIDEILLQMDRCRKLKRAVFSTPFTQMKRFTQFFKQYPVVMGATEMAMPINDSMINSQLGIETKMVRIEAKGSYCWSKDCGGFCVSKNPEASGSTRACQNDSDCGEGYCSKRTTDRKMTAIIDMSTGSLVHFDSK